MTTGKTFHFRLRLRNGNIINTSQWAHDVFMAHAAIGEDAIVVERTIDVHIKGMRKKLGDAGELIGTVRGVGYRFHDSRLVRA